MGRRKFSALQRERILHEMSKNEVDLIIIGGGITGCGIALDAVTRGMKTALVEMQDFAAGTSSRSTKLVHGGLRYLKQMAVKMVAEVGKERAVVFANGPHVTKPIRMLLPLYKAETLGRTATALGLRLYDFLADVRGEERNIMLTKSETLAKEPLLKSDGLLGGGYYVEYMTDDARLTIEVIKEAVAQGALAVNYAKALELIYRHGQVRGVMVEDCLTGRRYCIQAKRVVNAAGPWIDTIRALDRSLEEKKIRLTKGVHLVFPHGKIPVQQAVYFPVPDRRMLFAIPREGKTYVGTTDTFYEQDPLNPKVTAQDRDYILQAIHHIFPSVRLNETDIESSWAGVRPLIFEKGKNPSDISRKDEIWQSKQGLMTIAGGKLTGYRKMAEKVVDELEKELAVEKGGKFSSCVTRKLPISGGAFGGGRQLPLVIEKYRGRALGIGFTNKQYEVLVQRYGSNIEHIFSIAEQNRTENGHGLPLDLYAQVIYSIEEEMTVKPVDFFIRRTGALLFQIDWVHQWKEPVINFMAQRLKWSEKEKQSYRKELEERLLEAARPYNDSD